MQALEGKDSVLIFEDYRKIKVLSSFSPVHVPDNNWAILAEIDLNEAMTPLSSIRNNIFLVSTIISCFPVSICIPGLTENHLAYIQIKRSQ